MKIKNNTLFRIVSVVLVSYLVLNLLASIASLYFGFPALASYLDSSYAARYGISDANLQTSQTMLNVGAFSLIQSLIGLIAVYGVYSCIKDNKQRRWSFIFCVLSIVVALYNAITVLAFGSFDIATLVIDIALIAVFYKAIKMITQ